MNTTNRFKDESLNFFARPIHLVASLRLVASLKISFAVTISLLLFAGGAVSAYGDDTVAREPLPKSWEADAELTDVFFIDENLGWVVGESGTILRTRDGGNTWNAQTLNNTFRRDTVELQQKLHNLESGRRTKSSGITTGRQRTDSPITCRFNSVSFIDANQGWAAGGFQLPYINRTQAVVMHTRDGGITWQPIENLAIPRLRKIEFTSPRRGIAYGDSGNVFTGGIFETNDAGNSWSAISRQTDVAWIDAEQTKDHYVTVDNAGQLGRYSNGQYEAAVLLGDPVASKIDFRCVKMIDDNQGVAVGTQGRLFKTNNGGLSWQRVPIETTHPQLVHFDWQTAAVTDQKVVLAGFPGSTIATLDLKSNQLSTVKTPVRTKLNRLFFLNSKTGWAVGDFGVVLTTTDGGQTWRRQRGNTRGLAMLVVAPRSEQVPVELFARYSLESNRSCGVLVIEDTDAAFQAVRQASSRLGSCYHELIQSSTDSEEPLDPEIVIATLVRNIRTLKPAVVVSQAPQSYSQDISDPFQQISLAVKLAADPSAYPGHAKLGLTAHRVSRFAVQDPIGPITINPERILIQSGQQLQDQVALSRALLGKSTVDLTPNHYRVLESATGQAIKHVTDLMAALPSHQLPERLSKQSQQSNLSDIRFANESAKSLRDFADFKINTQQDLNVWRQQVREFLNSMEVDLHNGGTWMLRLIEQYENQGQTELAVQAAELLIARFPDSPYSIAVTTWLAKRYSSVEFGKLAFDQRVTWGVLQPDGLPSQAVRNSKLFATGPKATVEAGVTTLTWQPIQPPVKLGSGKPDADVEEPTIANVKASATEDIEDALAMPDGRPEFYLLRLQRSARLLSSIGQRDPDYAAGPYCQWLEVHLARQLNEVSPGTITNLPSRYKKLQNGRGPLRQGIADKVNHELSLLGDDFEALPELNSSTPDQPTVSNCVEIENRPNLDGRLSEACWQTAQAIPILVSAASPNKVNQPRAQAQFCRDAEFLYVAIACEKFSGLSYAPRQQVRARDGQLKAADHVWIQLDLDRDYDTGFNFAVDHQGWARESCDSVQDWDPEWFVSQHETETLWMIEAAIPLAAISPTKIHKGDRWSLRLDRRTSPNRIDRLKQDSEVTKSIFQHRPLPKHEQYLAF